jgi:lipopolysaccharide export system protein LptC
VVDDRTNMEANGMELNYQTHVIQFLSRVKTVYAPAKK